MGLKKFQNMLKNIYEVYQLMYFRCIMSLSYRVTFLCNVLVKLIIHQKALYDFFFMKSCKVVYNKYIGKFYDTDCLFNIDNSIGICFGTIFKIRITILRMTFKEEKDKKTKIRHRVAIICSCRIYVRRVLLFQREYMGMMYVKMKDNEFEKLIREFRNACKRLTY